MDERMDEDDDDENVWNASAVILDIDSGVPEDISFFFWSSFFFIKRAQPVWQVYFHLSCEWSVIVQSLMHQEFSSAVKSHNHMLLGALTLGR